MDYSIFKANVNEYANKTLDEIESIYSVVAGYLFATFKAGGKSHGLMLTLVFGLIGRITESEYELLNNRFDLNIKYCDIQKLELNEEKLNEFEIICQKANKIKGENVKNYVVSYVVTTSILLNKFDRLNVEQLYFFYNVGSVLN